jgi:hypothetical protein
MSRAAGTHSTNQACLYATPGVQVGFPVVTIRQYLMRRCSRAVTGTIAFLVVAGALVSSGPRVFVIRFVLAVVITAVVAAAIWSLFEIPCPNCRKPMGRVGFWVANGRMERTVPRCPHCDVSVDEEVPGAPHD